MEPTLRQILDFNSIQSFIQGKEGSFVDLLKEYYFLLGEDLGFESKKDFLVKANNIKLGSLDLAWLDSEKPVAGFVVSFGSKEDILSAVWKLVEFNSQYAVLVTSTKAKNFSLEEIRRLLTDFFLRKPPMQSFLAVDVSEEKFELVK